MNQKVRVIQNPKQNEPRQGNRLFFQSLKSFGKPVQEDQITDADSEYDIDDVVNQQFNQDIFYSELSRDDQDFMTLWNNFLINYNNNARVNNSTQVDHLSYHNLNGEFFKSAKFMLILDIFINENIEILKGSLKNQFLNHLFTLVQYCIVTPNQLLQIVNRLQK